ncbi:choline transporter-like protein 5 isoform X2 [Monodelphis domestica]|uniref:choline transporter-like protein 5 isoform X2 n=1 Tax=Monodelphis domestica TaxID=13616 RepID=UPI0024E200E6|nr:choline transporter-like protein 5 isoform X2 [Monodelphis domestica]
MVFILSYVALGLVAWDQGDAKKVAYAVDSRGDFCGQKNTPNEMKSVLFYFNILLCSSPVVLLKLHCPTTTVCVSTCPDRFLTFLEVQGRYTFNRSLWAYYQQYCKPGFDNPLKPALDVLRDQDCPPMIIPSRPFFKRCFPDLRIQDSILRIGNQTAFLDGSGILRNVSDLQEAAKDINLIRSMKILGFKILEDFASAWHWIVLALVLAMFSSFLFLLLLRFCASCILWIFVLGVIGIVAYGIGYSYLEYRHLHTSQGAQMTILDLGFHSDYKAYLKLEQTWLLFLILLSIVELLVLFLLLFLRKSIRIAVILLEEGSRIIGHMPQSLLFPLVTVFLVFICIGYWIVIAIFLSTSGEAVYKVVTVDTNCKYANEICNPKSFPSTNVSKECPSAHCNFASFGGKSLLYRWVIPLHAFNTFAFLWLVNFSIALGQCTLAGAFSSYYWAFLKPEDIPPNPICASFGRTLRYHTGSIALGAITLTTVQCLRFFLEYINHHLKDSKRMQSKFILCCCRFCLWCLEKFLKYLNRNAYIMVAIYGDNFCTAAQDAFHLVMRNVVRVAMLDKVTDFLLWLGKMLVSVSIGALGYLFFTQKLPIAAPTLNYYWIPLLNGERTWMASEVPSSSRPKIWSPAFLAVYHPCPLFSFT